jgi:hypothetical protein
VSHLSSRDQPGTVPAWSAGILPRMLVTPAVLALAAYLLAFLATFLVARLAFGPAVGIRNTLLSGFALGGLAAALLTGMWVASGRAPGRLWQWFWLLVALVALGAAVSSQQLTQQYGDSAYVLARIGDGPLVPKWLAGMALAGWIHAALWEFPPLAAVLPATLLTPAGFLGVVGAFAMAGATIACLRRWPQRMAVLLPTLTPIWLLFAAGYLEYYPLIAGALLAVLAWLFDAPLAARSPRAVGLVLAALPLLYVGFVPLAGLVLLAYTLAAPGRIWRTLGWALLGFAVMAALFWPPGVADYLRSLHGEYNLGEAWNHPRYQGQVAGEHSIFFRPAYALSAERLREVATMYLWAGGLAAPVLVLALGGMAMHRRPGTEGYSGVVGRGERGERGEMTSPLLALGLLAWQGFYMLFMVPKLGPRQDIDLFFAVYITVAFCAGLAADVLWPPGHPRRAQALAALCGVMLGCTAVSALYLLRLGVPGLG